jgi:anti-sigma factor RsiW
VVGASEASPQWPAFVEEARDAHRTELLRAAMRSQPSVTDYDPAEILSATRIAVPDLPSDWRILDMQVFPTAEGHCVEISVNAAQLGTFSLFATRLDGFAVIEPTVAATEGYRTAFWQIGHSAYALTGGAPERALERAAVELSQTLY